MARLMGLARSASGLPIANRLPLSAADLLLAIGLGSLSLLAHWPFRTQMLYAWDSVLFAYALDDFNVGAHQPQPPGYLFYVLMARLLRGLSGRPANEVYVWLSALAAAGTVAALCLAGRALFDRSVGVVAALLAASSVAFSVYAGVAYPYTTLALGSALLGWASWTLGHTSGRAVGLVGLLFGLLTGFRQDLALLLGPLMLHAFGRHGWRGIIVGLAAAGLGGLTWLVPTMLLSGGALAYWAALTAQATQVERDTSVLAQGLPALLANGRLLLRYATNTLYLALVPIALWAGHWLLTADGRRDRRSWHLALWALPAVLVYSLLHLGEIGYVFSFMPPAWLAAARGLQIAARWLSAWRPGWRPAVVLAGLAAGPVVFNLWWFLLSPLPLSAHWLACKDAALAKAVQQVQTAYQPADTLVVTGGYYQQARYYLSDYRIMAHNPFASPVSRWAVPAGIERVVVFDWALEPGSPARQQVAPLACDYTLVSYAAVPGEWIVVTPPRIELRP